MRRSLLPAAALLATACGEQPVVGPEVASPIFVVVDCTTGTHNITTNNTLT